MKEKWNLNSFNLLFEDSRAPYSRFFRTSLWEKFIDTFFIFLGTQKKQLEIETVGLIDYCTLGIFLFLHQYFMGLSQNYKKDFQSLALLIPCAVINAMAWLIKVGSCFLLTVFFSPLIIVCHGVSLCLGGMNMYSDLLSLRGKDTSSNGYSSSSLTLKNFLERYDRKLENAQVIIELDSNCMTTRVLETTVSLTDNLLSLFSDKKNESCKPIPKANLKLSFKYFHEETKPWLSDANFLYVSVFMLSLFPFLAIFSAKSISLSARDRLSSALKTRAYDRFDISINLYDEKQKQQLSSLFKLNISNALEELTLLLNHETTDSQLFKSIYGDSFIKNMSHN